MSLLLTALDDGTATREEVRNELVTLIVAGHETVASTLTWTWFLLAGNPSVARAVRTEAAGLPEAPWDIDTLKVLPVTRASIDESLRLYPPAWVVSRKSVEPDVLGGYPIPAGATIITSPYLLHRDGKVWSHPLTFDPSRFLPDAPRPVDRTSYLPFGAGPRLCIGRDLALLEAPLVIAGLARHVEVWPVSAAEPSLDFGVTLRPKGGLRAVVQPTVSARE
jgi:cytochrome P450